MHSADLDELVGTQTHIASGAVCAETPDQKLNEEERANVPAGWAWAICLRPAACTGLPPSTFRHNSAHMPHPPRSLLVLLLPLPASLLLLLPQNPKPCPFPLTPRPPGLTRRLRRCVCCWSSRQQQDSHHPHALLGNPWAQGHSTHIAAPHGEQGAVLRAPFVVSAHVMNHSREGVYPCIPTSQKLTALNSACTVN